MSTSDFLFPVPGSDKLYLSYTIGNHSEDICTDILFPYASHADAAARSEGMLAFSFEWDGQDAQTVTKVTEI